MTIGDKVRQRRITLGMTQHELALSLGYKNRTAINKIEKGLRSIPSSKLKSFASVLRMDVEQLINKSASPPLNIITLEPDNVFQIPIFASASAGFGAYASDEILGYMPVYINNPMEVNETMLIRVNGDSMEPKIENGDLIQVHKQTSVDNGDIAVVLINGDEGVVKKVYYGNNWIELRSLNPQYEVRRFEGREVLNLRILGRVTKVIKSL